MSDVMLMGILRMPPEIWNDDPIDILQRFSRYKEAAERIELLQQFIRNGVEFGYIVVPGNGDPARKIIDEILNR